MNSTEKEEEVPTIPGIKLLSNSLISNLLPINQHSSLQQCLGAFGLLLPEDLWSDNSNNPPSLARPPLSLCLSCGSYINYLADVSMEPGKWICAICYHPNGGKDYSMSQNTGDDYELHHPYYHCIEREPIFQHLGVVGSERLVVVAMDLRFLLSTSPECSERIFLTQLQDHLDKISQLVPISKDGLLSSVQLMLVLFDESSLRVTRLGEGRLEPLMVDVIPIHQLHQTYRWSQLLKRGIHALSIPRFLDSYEAIAKGLLGLVKTFGGASSSSSPFSAPLAMPSLSMLHFYSFLQQIQLVYAPIIEFKLLLVTCQSLPLFPLLPTDHTSTTSPQDKQRLMSVRSPADSAFVGKCFADRIYCSVGYIFIGNDVILTQELLPFLSATHGGLIVGERLSEEHISLSLLESLSSFILSDVTKISNRFFLQEKIEIRCNENIDLLKSFPGNSGFLTLQERQDSLKEGRQKRKEHQVIDDLLSTYQSSSAKLPSYFAQSVATKGDITPLIQKRFPLHLSVTLNTSPLDNALDSNDNRLRPFDPVLLIRENADMSEEELDERHLMSQFIDVHHLKRSYDDYLAYLHDEKVKHQRSIYRIPLKTFYDKILLQFSDHPDNFFDRSLHFPSNQASSGQFACLFNVLDPSPLTEEGEHQPRPHNVDGTEGSVWNGYWSKLSQLFAPSAPATDKGRKFTGTENGDAMQPLSLEDSLMDANHGIIQIQWKSLYYLPDSAEKVKETKVITLKVPIKPIRPNTNPLLDARLWTSLQMKCLVSHYHHLTRQLRFSGRTDELGNDVIKQHRYDMMRLIDEITQVLSKHWASRGILSKEEILQFVRAIFFLREGPLLDGPSVNIEESNVLRNTFLRSELASETEKALLAPRMWLDLSLLPLSSSTHILSSQNIFEVHPSSMMLLPGTIALVDCGSVLVIRRNILPSSFTLSHTFSEISVLAALRALATQIARCRYPVPRIELITDALTPRDRLVFARLSPDHMYFKDTAQSLNASVIAETLMSDMQQARHLKGDEERVWKDVFSIYKLEDYQALLLSSPYTEQRYFTQYAKLQTAQVLFPMNDSIPLPQSSCYPPPT